MASSTNARSMGTGSGSGSGDGSGGGGGVDRPDALLDLVLLLLSLTDATCDASDRPCFDLAHQGMVIGSQRHGRRQRPCNA